MAAGHRTASIALGGFLLKKCGFMSEGNVGADNYPPAGAKYCAPTKIKNKQKGKIMAVVIRLARHGAKKNPFYHIVVADSRNARDSGAILERIGSYDPMQPKDSNKRVVFDADKAKAWMAKGAKPSDRVYKFLANAGLLAKRDAPVQTKKNQPSEKTKKKIEDRNAKIAKAREAAAAAKAEVEKPAAPVEAPAAETPAEPAAE